MYVETPFHKVMHNFSALLSYSDHYLPIRHDNYICIIMKCTFVKLNPPPSSWVVFM